MPKEVVQSIKDKTNEWERDGKWIDSKKEDHNISQMLSIDVINEDFFLEKAYTDVSVIVNQISGLTLNDKQIHITKIDALDIEINSLYFSAATINFSSALKASAVPDAIVFI